MIYYIRNSVDSLIGFYYNNDKYYYIKNNLDDIIGILDSNYNVVANYTYDSWGNILSITDSNGLDISNDESHIANINPFRYRSYYYDIENGYYYLNSRYYNPLWGRFLNADGIIGANGNILGNNLYAYCSNNPIGRKDNSGFSAIGTSNSMFNSFKSFAKTVAATVSAAATVVGVAGAVGAAGAIIAQKKESLNAGRALNEYTQKVNEIKSSLNQFTTKSSVSFGPKQDLYFEVLGVPFGGGVGAYVKKETVGTETTCYLIGESKFGLILGKKKSYEARIDCDNYRLLSGTVYKEEVLIGPIRIMEDNSVYLDFSEEADIGFFSLEAGLEQKH